MEAHAVGRARCSTDCRRAPRPGGGRPWCRAARRRARTAARGAPPACRRSPADRGAACACRGRSDRGGWSFQRPSAPGGALGHDIVVDVDAHHDARRRPGPVTVTWPASSPVERRHREIARSRHAGGRRRLLHRASPARRQAARSSPASLRAARVAGRGCPGARRRQQRRLRHDGDDHLLRRHRRAPFDVLDHHAARAGRD